MFTGQRFEFNWLQNSNALFIVQPSLEGRVLGGKGYGPHDVPLGRSLTSRTITCFCRVQGSCRDRLRLSSFLWFTAHRSFAFQKPAFSVPKRRHSENRCHVRREEVHLLMQFDSTQTHTPPPPPPSAPPHAAHTHTQTHTHTHTHTHIQVHIHTHPRAHTHTLTH